MGEALERASAFIESVSERHSGETILLVTHCDIIRALLCQEHGRSLDDILSFEAPPASLTILAPSTRHKVAA
jgi:broad specificity phosphatase PhoE